MPLHKWSPLPNSLLLILNSWMPPHLPPPTPRLGQTGLPHCSSSNYAITPGGGSVSLIPGGKVHESGGGVCTWSLAVSRCPA